MKGLYRRPRRGKQSLRTIKVGDRLRPLDHDKVAELAESICRQGLLQPIVITQDGDLVAGHHRLEAARSLGWEEIEVVRISDDRFALLAEIEENLVRSDLSVLEQGEHLLARDQELVRLGLRAQVGDNQHGGPAPGAGPMTTSDIGDQVGLSARSVRERVQIARAIPEEIRDLIRGTPVANRTKALLDLARVRNKGQLPELARLLVDGRAKTVLAARGLLRHRQRAALADRLASEGAGEPPEGPFGVIVVDPPWAYDVRQDDPSHRVGPPYPSMSVEEIKELPVSDLADDDAVLWLWVTNGGQGVQAAASLRLEPGLQPARRGGGGCSRPRESGAFGALHQPRSGGKEPAVAGFERRYRAAHEAGLERRDDGGPVYAARVRGAAGVVGSAAEGTSGALSRCLGPSFGVARAGGADADSGQRGGVRGRAGGRGGVTARAERPTSSRVAVGAVGTPAVAGLRGGLHRVRALWRSHAPACAGVATTSQRAGAHEPSALGDACPPASVCPHGQTSHQPNRVT